MKKYKNARYQRKNDRKTDELLGMLQESSLLMEYIEKEYPYDRERIEVLKKILLAAGNNSFEEMEQNIFLYGSMARGQDLLARQVFLWLVGMSAENKRMESVE